MESPATCELSEEDEDNSRNALETLLNATARQFRSFFPTVEFGKRARCAVEHARQEYEVSERRACRVVRQWRGTQRYLPLRRTDEDQLTQAILALAVKYGRYGYRRITALLQDAVWAVGKDRVQRIWRREGLKVPQKQRPRGRLWFGDAAGHNQFMELAKTFLQRCPELTPTVNRDKADFVVTMNWAPTTRYFIGGKLVHKPDQILVVNKDGDIIFSGVARTVGGNTEDACKAIMHSLQQGLMKRSEPAEKAALEPVPVDAARTPGTAHTPVEAGGTSTMRDPASPANSSAGIAEEVRVGMSFTGNPTAKHNGIEITGVQPNGPADKIDIKPGDVIISIDGHYLYTVDELRAELVRHENGARLAIRYRRDRLTYDNYISLGPDVATPRR